MSPVPRLHQADGLDRIEIYSDETDTGGAFLFLFRALEQECASDEWYPTVELAKASAFRRYGIGESDWTDVDC
jgi:hypothetical protein